MKLYARRGFEWAEDALVGLWSPVSTGATQGVLLDSNPSTSNHGTLTNFANLNAGWVGSLFGSVVDFDGVNDHIDLGSFYSSYVRNFTISTWVLHKTPPASNSSDIILGWGNNNIAAQGIFLKVDNNSGNIRYVIQKNQQGSSAITRVLPQFQRWMHLVLICNGSTVIFYTNSALNLSQSFGTTVQSSSSFFIGGRGSSQPCEMQSAEVCMWSKTLELKEVELMFQAGPGGMWQDRPRAKRSYFAQLINRRRQSRFLVFPG